MKYIDSEKLLAEIERKISICEKQRSDAIGVECYNLADHASARIGELHVIQETIASLQQEQPEVDLEKFTDKIKTFQERYKYPEVVSIKGAMAFMARMFYQYPNVARQWYDSLPKATMD